MQADPDPGQRDLEEQHITVERVSIPELKTMMLDGSMLLPSITTCYMAFEELRAQGYKL